MTTKTNANISINNVHYCEYCKPHHMPASVLIDMTQNE